MDSGSIHLPQIFFPSPPSLLPLATTGIECRLWSCRLWSGHPCGRAAWSSGYTASPKPPASTAKGPRNRFFKVFLNFQTSHRKKNCNVHQSFWLMDMQNGALRATPAHRSSAAHKGKIRSKSLFVKISRKLYN
jgi:hypothetical protein